MAIVVLMQVVVMVMIIVAQACMRKASLRLHLWSGKAREMQAPGSLAAASQCSRANPGSVWFMAYVSRSRPLSRERTEVLAFFLSFSLSLSLSLSLFFLLALFSISARRAAPQLVFCSQIQILQSDAVLGLCGSQELQARASIPNQSLRPAPSTARSPTMGT